MKKAAAKDFGAIESDYDFFMASSTEAERDLDAYRRHVDNLTAADGPIRMLDFGCGAGDFSVDFLTRAGWRSDRLNLSLVEPVEPQRRRAAERLERFTDHPIEQWSLMPEAPIGPFDVVLANHVFYYVPDLDETLRRIVESLAPAGVLLTAMAGRTNVLTGFWDIAFETVGLGIPYHRSEDLEASFDRAAIDFRRDDVTYRLRFPDSTDNRMKILRFLLADHLSDVPEVPLLEHFNRWRCGDEIVIDITHHHYVVRGGGI
jgi:SAM-dependent methyltransferase